MEPPSPKKWLAICVVAPWTRLRVVRTSSLNVPELHSESTNVNCIRELILPAGDSLGPPATRMLSSYIRCSARAPYSIRQFTTTARVAKNGAKSSSPRIPVPPQMTFERSRQSHRIQTLAIKMLEAGRDEIYRNTASRGYIGATLAIVVLSYTGVMYLYSTRLWDDQLCQERGLRWWVPKAYQAAMICWGVIAAYAFTKTLGVVKAIRLIKSGDRVLMETSIHRPIPFMKPEKYISEPETLIVSRSKLYGAAPAEGMIVAPEGESLVTRMTRTLFYAPFHNTRKALGGAGLVPIQVGPTGSQRHLVLDADGQFSNGGQDLLDLSEDQI